MTGRGRDRSGGREQLIDAVLDGAAVAVGSLFFLRFLSAGVLLWTMTDGGLGARNFLMLMSKPLAGLAAGLVLAASRAVPEARRGWPGRAAAACACAALLAFAFSGPLWRGSEFLLGPLAAMALAALIAPVAVWMGGGVPSRRSLLAGSVAGMVVLASALALWPGAMRAQTNVLGLISGFESTVYTEDYSGHSNKDRYPVCRFSYNSLGFRDEEPDSAPGGGRQRVLVVGDSYVWGDGIAANEETLAYRLRARLERSAPGRFSVMAAAYPGLGLYGYAKFIDAVGERFRPKIVVVGYLGGADHDPFDAQFLLDHVPSARPFRNLLLNLGTLQQVHDASIRSQSVWASPENAAVSERIREDLARKAVERGYRLVFLAYFAHPPLPSTSEVVGLPSELEYQGRPTELWYGKDFHPKPKLNDILAGMLAEKLLLKEGWRPDSASRSAGVRPGRR
ncbi:MAG: hypothetical protein HZB91_12635 [Elusimicrobia bacterium]|nr:hypothetical protein [Elusimicrobiota bacterium]